MGADIFLGSVAPQISCLSDHNIEQLHKRSSSQAVTDNSSSWGLSKLLHQARSSGEQ